MIKQEFERHKNRLENLLNYAYNNIPFYKENLIHNPAFYLKNYENWCQLPILKKEMIQEDWEKLVLNTSVDNNSKIVFYTTSGTTGAPMRIYRNRSEEVFLTKLLWQERQKWSKDIMKWKLLYLYRRLESSRQNVLRISNDFYLDLSENSILAYSHEIESYKPDWIIGPPTAVTRLAQIYKEMNKSIPSLNLIELYGEMVLPHQKRLIEETFNCPVVNHYGTREFYVMSYECPKRKMHAQTNHLFFELVKDGQPVQNSNQGELVVTSLTNMFMPFVRYYVGDMVTIEKQDEPCKCGNEHFLLIPNGGRIAHLIETKNKTFTSVVIDRNFSCFFDNNPNVIKEFQLIQENIEHFKVRLVPGSSFKHEKLIELERELRNILEDELLEFELVEYIPNSDSGKTPTFISKLTMNK